MKITKSVYRISETVDVSTDITVSIKNTWEHDIAWLRHGLLFLSKEGKYLGAETTYSDEVIEQGARGKLYVGPWLQRRAKEFQAEGPVKVQITTTLCRKVRLRLGEVAIPADGATTVVGEARDLEGLGFRGLRCSRWTEDGEIRLQLDSAVENRTDRMFDRCVLRVSLLDEDESPVEESSADELVRPRQVQPLQTAFYSLKKGQLKNASLRVWLEAYVAFATDTGEAVLEFRKGDDYDDDDGDEDDDDATDSDD